MRTRDRAVRAAGATYDANINRACSVLVASDLPARLQADLAERFAAIRPGEEESELAIEVSVAGYGFMAPASENVSAPSCFTFAADLAVKKGEQRVFDDQIFEELYADLSLEKFGISAERLDEGLDRIRQWV